MYVRLKVFLNKGSPQDIAGEVQTIEHRLLRITGVLGQLRKEHS